MVIGRNSTESQWWWLVWKNAKYSKNVHYFLEFCLVLYSVHIPVMSKMVSIYSGFSNNLLIGWDPADWLEVCKMFQLWCLQVAFCRMFQPWRWLVGILQNVSKTMTLIGWNIAECFNNHDAHWLEYCRMFQQPWRWLVGILQDASNIPVIVFGSILQNISTMMLIGWNSAEYFNHDVDWLEFCRMIQPWCWLVGFCRMIQLWLGLVGIL